MADEAQVLQRGRTRSRFRAGGEHRPRGLRRVAAVSAGLVLMASTVGITMAAAPAGASIVVSADAGAPQSVESGTTVTLSGDGFSPTGDPIAFSWTQDSGPAVTLSDDLSQTPTFTAPTGPADLEFTLTVDDGNGTDTASTSVHVYDPTPVADAGADQSGFHIGDTVSLDASASYNEAGNSMSFSWAQIGGTTSVSLSDSSASPSFTAPAGQDTLTFEVTVYDDINGYSATDTVDVSISSSTPTADAGADQQVEPNSTVYLDGSLSSSPDGLELSYAWTQTDGPTVTLTDDTTAFPSFTAPADASSFTFQLTVSTVYGDTATDDVVITMNNNGPIADAGVGQSGFYIGDTVTLDGSGSSDPDLQTLSYSWSQTGGLPVTLSDSTAVSPTFTAPSGPDDLYFDLTVTDTSGASATSSTSVSIYNTSTTADAGPDQTGAHVGEYVYLDGTGSYDPDINVLFYEWTQISGPPVDLNFPYSEGPSFVAPGGPATLVFTLTTRDVSDYSLTSSDDVTITIDNTDPSAYAGTTVFGLHAGDTGTLDGSGSSDPDGSSLTYSWVQTSGGTVTIADPTAAQTTFTAPAGPDTLYFDLTVSDGTSTNTASVAYTVDNSPPVADAGPTQSGAAFPTLVTLDGSGSYDLDGQSLTYAWTQTAGDPVSLSDSSAVQPTFTPPIAPQTLSFDLTVSDPYGFTTSSTSVIVGSSSLDLSAAVAGTIGRTSLSNNFTVTVTNHSTTTQVVTAANVTGGAIVNGIPVPSSQLSVLAKTVTLKPNTSASFRLTWNHPRTTLKATDVITVLGCASLFGDGNSANDCGAVSTVTGVVDLSAAGTLSPITDKLIANSITTVVTNNSGDVFNPLRSTDYSVGVKVNGESLGAVSTRPGGAAALSTGGSTTRNFRWTHPRLHHGDIVVITTCVVVTGNTSPSSCSSQTVVVP